MKTRTLAVSATAGIGLAVSALVAPTATATADPYAGHFTTSMTAVDGKIDGLRGNAHQMRLATSGGHVRGSSYIRSYYCPSGGRVTATWASSKCTYRSTLSLVSSTHDGVVDKVGRVSSTGQSAVQHAPVRATSKWVSPKHIVVDLKMKWPEDPQVWGTVEGQPLVPGVSSGSFDRF